jgi:hypothetical protein
MVSLNVDEISEVCDKIVEFINSQKEESDKLSVKQICEDLADLVEEVKSDVIDYGEQQ